MLISACWLTTLGLLYKYGILEDVIPTSTGPKNRISQVMSMEHMKLDYDLSPLNSIFHSKDKVIVELFAFLMGAHSIVNGLIWVLVVTPRHKAKAGDGTEANKRKELQEVMQNELLFFTGLGVRAAVRQPVRGDANGGQGIQFTQLQNYSDGT